MSVVKMKSVGTMSYLSRQVLVLFHIQVTCTIIALTVGLIPTLAASYVNVTDDPLALFSDPGNATSKLDIATQEDSLSPIGPQKNVKRGSNASSLSSSSGSSSSSSSPKNNDELREPLTAEDDIPREFPTALVTASSIAAVCILVFFFVSYCWHTRQLDSRARKLAIRLAADAEHGMRCRNCNPSSPRKQIIYQRAAVIESPQEQNSHYQVLSTDDEQGGSIRDAVSRSEERSENGGRVGSTCGGGGPGSDGGRSSVGVSESEAGDSEDPFEPSQSSAVLERVRNSVVARGGRGSHRKYSRSRKTSAGTNADKRDSTVTDKDILTHFAKRRHSTFFI